MGRSRGDVRFQHSADHVQEYRGARRLGAAAASLLPRAGAREIQLTEQGLNSRDYSEAALRDQAAGLAYAWKKIKPLKTITAFQYHLWADNRGEGGLRLGLRKFADDSQDPLGKKPSWAVYQSLGTDREDAAAAFAKPIIGIKDWSDILHRGEIK